MNDLEELLGSLQKPKPDPNESKGLVGWELVDYEASIADSNEVRLTKDQRDELNTKCPFFIVTDEYGLVAITSVSRRFYTTEGGYDIAIEKGVPLYDSEADYQESVRKNMAIDAKRFFKKHGISIEIYSKFRDENPEFFI